MDTQGTCRGGGDPEAKHRRRGGGGDPEAKHRRRGGGGDLPPLGLFGTVNGELSKAPRAPKKATGMKKEAQESRGPPPKTPPEPRGGRGTGVDE